MNFKEYQIAEIYQVLHGSRNNLIEVTDTHKDFIKNWCNEKIMLIDIKNAISTTNNNSFSVDWTVKYLWFFINKLDISIPKDKFLDFTLYYEFENYSKKGNSIIETLEHFINKTDIKKRVIKNISEGIVEINAWKSNTNYAILNNLKISFPYILRDLKDTNKPENYRGEILELYFKKTQNFEAVRNLLKSVMAGQFKWAIVRLLIKFENQRDFLRDHLKNILFKNHELFDNRLTAAEFLVQLNDLEGLNYISNLILTDVERGFQLRERFNCLSYVKDVNAIPILIKLLKIAKEPVFKQDRFYHNIESIIFTSLHNIEIQSEENYLYVKKELENFISENHKELEYLNFIHLNIQRMEEQLYLNKSQSYTIEDAIGEFNKLKLIISHQSWEGNNLTRGIHPGLDIN